MSTAQKIALREPTRRTLPLAGGTWRDQRLSFRGSWATYEHLLADRGEKTRPRISFLDGMIELVMPSLAHEHDKATIGRLVNAWSEEAGVGLEAIGSWTIKRKRGKAGAEPDQCYTVNGLHRGGPKPRVPDFAIEVVRGTEEIDKLEIYRRLGVREVWKWQNGTLTFHVRNDGAYVLEDHSHFMPMVDPDLLASLMKMQFQVDAIRTLRRAIARKKKR